MERVHSTTSLPQRRWSSNSVQDQRVSRPTTFSLRNSGRPMSTLGSRPVSGFSNRPVSGRISAQSRPGTALNKSVPPLLLQDSRSDSTTQTSARLSRPASAVRPLSGRIFMRKTQERGWVAKNLSYDELEIEDYDDNYSETQSLDSFFDDDFDTEEQDEKLQRLLTCTTLGVSSKGQNKDWVSGEVTVPKFHCPRCRDHYYGLTPFPCDEEIARLIREGLWHTGEGITSPDRSIRHGMMKASLSSTDTQRHRKNSEGDYQSSSKIKLPPLDTSKSSNSQNSSWDNSNVPNTTTNKKKKRISFALDNLGVDGSPSASDTNLNQSRNSSGRKRKGSDLLTVLDANASNSSLDKYGLGAGAQKKSDNQSSTSKLLDSQTQLGGGGGDPLSDANCTSKAGSDKGQYKGKANNKNNGDILGGTNSHTNGVKNQRGGKESMSLTDDGNSSKKGSTISDVGSVSTGNSSDSAAADSVNCNSNGKNGSTGRGGSSTGDNTGAGGITSNNQSNVSGDGKDCNITSKGNSKSSVGSNSRDNSYAKKSHKAPPGYMRAASPSQSDWGDPTHAKKWINNVALKPTSQFKYNTDDDDHDDEFSSMTRGSWRNRLRKPPKSEEPDDSLLLPLGPSLTRAFTFSYMSHAKPKK